MPETIRVATRRANSAGRIKKSTPPDQMMDYWKSHSAWAMTDDDFTKAKWARYVVDVDELRNWDQSKKFRGDAAPDWVKGAIHPRNQGFKDLAKKLAVPNPPGFQVAPNTFSFPHPPIPTEPAEINKLAEDPDRTADRNWMLELYKWEVHWEGDGSLELDPVGPLDLYIGRFGWRVFPCGTVERKVEQSSTSDPSNPAGKPTTVYTLRVTKVGIFAIDKYDFTNDDFYWDQPLGEWNVDAGSEGIRSPWKPIAGATGLLGGDLELTTTGLYHPNMGWRTVTNKVFEAYRRGTNLGRDFVILSNVKYVDFARTFVSKDDGTSWTEQPD
jgi:hypothetical protein